MISVDMEREVILLKKNIFKQDEYNLFALFSIKCDGLVVVLDPRYVSKQSLLSVIRVCEPEIYSNPTSDTSKKLFAEIKQLYDKVVHQFELLCKERLWYYNLFFQHQKDTLFFSSHRKVSQLSLEQGLGKTITAISDSVIHGFKLTIIIAPVTPMWNWYEDLTDANKSDDDIKWGFDVNWFTVFNSRKKITGCDEKFILINYEIVEKHIDELIAKKPNHIIIDECHKIKNRDSRRSKAVARLCRTTGAKVTLLSGTPAPNQVVDYFMYLNIANHPYGRNYVSFINNFTTYIKNDRYGIKITGGKNLEHLNDAISNFMIRKVKAKCLDLPGKRYIRINFTFDDYKDEYNKFLQDFLMNSKSRGDSDMAIHSLNKIIAKSKVKQACELAETILLDEDVIVHEGKEIRRKKKVIIFCTYKEPIAMLREYFKERCVVLDGSVPTDKRMLLVNQFKREPSVQVFIGQTASAAESLNLTNVSDIIFLNFTLTRSELDQLTDRADRIGQKYLINVYLTVCRNSIDEKLYKLITKKHADTSKLVDGKSEYMQTEDTGIKELMQELFKETINN